MLIDLDDTLVCFDGVSHEAWARACESYAGCNTQEERLRLAGAISDYAHWYYSDPVRHKKGRNNLEETRRNIVREAFKTLGIYDPGGAGTVADTYSRIRTDLLYLFPGVHDTLAAIRDLRIRLGLITNGEGHLQRRKIERFDLARHFDVILIEGELGYGKPDRRVYSLAVEKLGVNPSDIWIVGDNFEWEIAVPSQLGFTGIWHDWRGAGLPSDARVQPDAIINDIPSLLPLLEASTESS